MRSNKVIRKAVVDMNGQTKDCDGVGSFVAVGNAAAKGVESGQSLFRLVTFRRSSICDVILLVYESPRN
jgi:hypothetical protein